MHLHECMTQLKLVTRCIKTNGQYNAVELCMYSMQTYFICAVILFYFMKEFILKYIYFNDPHRNNVCL